MSSEDFFFPMRKLKRAVVFRVVCTMENGSKQAYDLRARHRFECYDHALERFPHTVARIAVTCSETLPLEIDDDEQHAPRLGTGSLESPGKIRHPAGAPGCPGSTRNHWHPTAAHL